MDKHILIDIAKKTIEKELKKSVILDTKKLKDEFSFLNEKRATFVTLYLNAELRGCIGTLYATKTLLEDLINNSYMAAFLDPRFFRLTLEEFEKIEIEISLLSHPVQVFYDNFSDLKQKIIPNKDGVILEFKEKRSTFLPQVWEQLPDFDDFFTQLCYKGGFDIDENFKPKVYKYEVEKIK